jgi:catechol 2,3-dioxygenase-like lactoylglutathione lyase family enzyme
VAAPSVRSLVQNTASSAAAMHIKPRFGFALEYVPDVEEAKRFYVDVKGLEVERYHPSFVQFSDASGSYFAVASDESVGGSGADELYWVVEDAEAAFRELSGRAEISMPLREMPFGKVFGVRDPAGQPRYLLEFAQNRPSRSAS